MKILGLLSLLLFSQLLFGATADGDVLKVYFQLFDQGKYTALIEQLDKVEVAPALLGKKYYLLAKAHSRLQEYDVANKLFKSSIDQKFEEDDFYYEYGQSLFAANELKSAQIAFIRSYRKNFKQASSLYYVGHIYQILEEYKDALEFYLTVSVNDRADDKILQIAHFQVAEIEYQEALKSQMAKAELTKLVDKSIVPRLQKAYRLDRSGQLGLEIKTKISTLMSDYKLDPDLLVSGRRISLKRYNAYVAQRFKYDDNVSLVSEENNVSQSLKPSFIYESEAFAKYDFIVNKKYIISPEARFNFIQYSDQQNADVYQNNSYGFYYNLRTKTEHQVKEKPASFLADLEYSKTNRDWKKTHTREPYASSFNVVLGEQLSYFSRGDSSFKFKYKNFSGINQLINNHTLTFSGDQTLFLPYQQLVVFLIEYNRVDNYNNVTSNTNTLTGRVDYLALEIFPKYNLGLAMTVVMTDTLEQKDLRGTEITLNPSFDISKEINENLQASFNFDYSKNSSKLPEYSYKKKVFSTELRYSFWLRNLDNLIYKNFYSGDKIYFLLFILWGFMKKIIVVFLSAIILSSCTTTYYRNQPGSALVSTIENKLVAQVQVDMSKKITGVATQTKILGFTTQGPERFADGVAYGVSGAGGSVLDVIFADSRDEVKSAAAYEATKAGGVDVIVAPQYIIEKKGFAFFYSKISVKVTGYPGVIKKIE